VSDLNDASIGGADPDDYTAIQMAFGEVGRRSKDFHLLESIGARVGYSLEGPYYGTLSRLGLVEQCTVTELAEMLALELSTVSRRVRELEERGLVERRPSPTDRRTSYLRLTADGRRLFEALSTAWRDMLGEVLADWDPGSVAEFRHLFDRFAADLARYANQGPPGPRHLTALGGSADGAD
jgi:DNA-binding MarR family transcriptional regulator